MTVQIDVKCGSAAGERVGLESNEQRYGLEKKRSEAKADKRSRYNVVAEEYNLRSEGRVWA